MEYREGMVVGKIVRNDVENRARSGGEKCFNLQNITMKIRR